MDSWLISKRIAHRRLPDPQPIKNPPRLRAADLVLLKEYLVISTAEFRNGSRLMVDGQPFYIVEFQHVKPGKGGAFVRTKLKSYLTGNVLDRTFRSGERFEDPPLEECDMQFLYATNDSYTFMDTATYEQSTYEKSQLGANADLLK